MHFISPFSHLYRLHFWGLHTTFWKLFFFNSIFTYCLYNVSSENVQTSKRYANDCNISILKDLLKCKDLQITDKIRCIYFSGQRWVENGFFLCSYTESLLTIHCTLQAFPHGLEHAQNGGLDDTHYLGVLVRIYVCGLERASRLTYGEQICAHSRFTKYCLVQ